MRIGIDAHMVGTRETGNESFIAGIGRALHKFDTQNDYYVFIRDKYHALLSELERPNFQLVRLYSDSAVLRNLATLPQKVREHDLDLLYVTYIAPLFRPCPVVVAVHDISYVHFPEFFPLRVRLLLAALVPWTLRRAAHVTVLSEHTKKDLIRHYRVPEEKISVIYLSVSDRFRPIEKSVALGQVRRKYPVNERFLLTVGNLQPRKNLDRLLRAFAQLRRAGQIQHQFVIVGQDLWYAGSIHRAVQQLGLENEVILTGYVPDEDLPLLYNAADLFVYPSVFEGFGIPPLEAMSCGTPTITSNTSSLPEVMGDPALTFDPYDVEAMAQTIYEVLSDEARRTMLARQCLERSKFFSWERSAHLLLQAFEQVYHQHQA